MATTSKLFDGLLEQFRKASEDGDGRGLHVEDGIAILDVPNHTTGATMRYTMTQWGDEAPIDIQVTLEMLNKGVRDHRFPVVNLADPSLQLFAEVASSWCDDILRLMPRVYFNR